MTVKKIQQSGQRDEVVDQRHRRRIAEIDLAECDFHEIQREEAGGLARTAAGHHRGSV